MSKSHLEKCPGESLWNSCLFGARGGGAVREANGTSLNCRARIPEACSRAIKGINDMQFIFKENSPKRAAQMGKGIPTELDGAGGALKMRQQTSER